MVAGGLIVEHDIIGARNSHEVIAPCGGQEQQQIVSRVLVGGCVIGVADIASYRETKQFSHEMVFETGANNLALVIQILWTDEANHTVHDKWLEYARHSVGSSLERELVNPVVGFGRERASLPSLKVHYIVTFPDDVSLLVVLHDLFPAFAQHSQRDTETTVGRFRSGNGLEKQVDGRTTFHRRQLRGDVRQAAGLRGSLISVHQALKPAQNSADGLDRISGGIHSDDGIAAPVKQALKSCQQYAADVIGWMIGLDADAQHSALAHGIAATSDVADLGSRENQILVAHDLGRGRGNFRDDRPLDLP